MFKRVDRRRKRKEIEERLGLDDDERGVFGLHDTDSSESESESDASESASSSATSSDGHRTQPTKKRKLGASPPSNDDESDEDENEELAADDEEDESGSGEYGSALRLTIGSALKEPVRLIRTDPEAWVCTFCPGKTLKHAAMVKIHEVSRIHRGRFKRIQELAMDFSPDEDLRIVLDKSATEAQPKADGTTLSRRAELRKAKQAKLKERRKKIKEKKAVAMAAAKAKKSMKTAETDAMTGHSSDEATQTSKRLKLGRSRHRTSPQAEPRRRVIKASRKDKATTKTFVPAKSKTKTKIHGATPT